MKTLAYSIVLLSTFLLISSCQKDGVLPSINKPPITDTTKKVPIANPGCDTTKLINLVLYNGTSVGSFEIALSGPANYTFTFPVHGSITVALKPGTYAVKLYSPGNYLNYDFNLTGQGAVKGSGARFTGVVLAPCAGPQFASIAEIDGNNP